MVRESEVQYVFAEPSGIVIPFELRNTVAAAGRDVRVDAGPVVMLLNAADPASPFHEHLAHVTRQQLGQADLIVLTKMDAAADGAVDRLRASANEAAPGTPLHTVSLAEGDGVAALVDAILGPAI